MAKQQWKNVTPEVKAKRIEALVAARASARAARVAILGASTNFRHRKIADAKAFELPPEERAALVFLGLPVPEPPPKPKAPVRHGHGGNGHTFWKRIANWYKAALNRPVANLDCSCPKCRLDEAERQSVFLVSPEARAAGIVSAEFGTEA